MNFICNNELLLPRDIISIQFSTHKLFGVVLLKLSKELPILTEGLILIVSIHINPNPLLSSKNKLFVTSIYNVYSIIRQEHDYY